MYKTKNDQSKYTQTWAGTLDFSDKSEINQTYNIQTQKLIHECKQITVIGIFIKKKKKLFCKTTTLIIHGYQQ